MTIHNPRVTALLLLTFGATASFGLLADPKERLERDPVSISDMQIRLDQQFNTIDVDNSETLTLAEYQAAVPQRDHDDRPGHRDGPRHSERSFRGRPGPERDFDREAFAAAVFEAMDLDGNGELSAAEAGRENREVATRKVIRTTRFERLDNNADGLLDRSEFSAPVQRLIAADTDSDGAVTREEMRAARRNTRS